MFAFVGYLVQANGIHFPFNLQQPWVLNPDIPTISYADISAAGGPADQWDALPTAAKVQIFGMIGFLEWWSETSRSPSSWTARRTTCAAASRATSPSSRARRSAFPHPVPLNLWDPFGFTSKMLARAARRRRLLAEINNGRLAQIGIIGMICVPPRASSCRASTRCPSPSTLAR